MKLFTNKANQLMAAIWILPGIFIFSIAAVAQSNLTFLPNTINMIVNPTLKDLEQSSQKLIVEKEEAKRVERCIATLLAQLTPEISINVVYISPAAALRIEADRIERREKEVAEARKTLLGWQEHMKVLAP